MYPGPPLHELWSLFVLFGGFDLVVRTGRAGAATVDPRLAAVLLAVGAGAGLRAAPVPPACPAPPLAPPEPPRPPRAARLTARAARLTARATRAPGATTRAAGLATVAAAARTAALPRTARVSGGSARAGHAATDAGAAAAAARLSPAAGRLSSAPGPGPCVCAGAGRAGRRRPAVTTRRGGSARVAGRVPDGPGHTARAGEQESQGRGNPREAIQDHPGHLAEKIGLRPSHPDGATPPVTAEPRIHGSRRSGRLNEAEAARRAPPEENGRSRAAAPEGSPSRRCR